MSSSTGVGWGHGALPVAAVGLWAAVVAAFALIGSDLMWVVALGDVVRDTGSVPRDIPFAVAEQSGWHNPIVVAELLLSFVHGMGDAGLVVLQLGIVVATLLVLVVEGRRLGGRDAAVAGVISLVVVGAATSFVIARLPSLSLVPFVLALGVMRRQHERPSRAAWLLVPLYVLWGNLHGGVLVGLAVLGVFLLTSPGGGSLMRRLGLGLGCASALLLTSAGLSTPAYYVAALGNEAAARGSDLWARPNLANPLDLAMLLAALVLVARMARRHPPLWEWLALAGLAVGTLSAARNGVWLVLFLAPAALRPRTRDDEAAVGPRPGVRSLRSTPVVLVAVAGVAVSSVVLALRDVGAPGSESVAVVREVAAGRPVLADEPFAETLAQAGVTVWAANPIDAFPREVQAQFLDFLASGAPPVDAAGIEVAAVDERRASGLTATGEWVQVRTAGGVVVLERRP